MPAYNFPNDELEQDRLDLLHFIFTLRMGGKLFLAPLSNPKRILDIGTGTGMWAMELADQFPDAQILANDLSPIQPQWVPPNVMFEVDDVESEWADREPFDFTHSRYMAASIKDWPNLVQSCFSQTAKGGWCEFQDFNVRNYSEDDSIPEDSKVLQLYYYIEEACEKKSRTAIPGPSLKKWMEDAGFENVHEEIYRLPLGPWPKDPTLRQVGALNMAQLLDGLEAFTINLFNLVLGWEVEKVHAFLKEVRADAKRTDVHMLHNFHVVYGQRVK